MAAPLTGPRPRRRWIGGSSGTAMAEALIAVPLLVLFVLAVLEFGGLFWQRQVLQTGIRDAARYLSRCQPAFSGCSSATARNIAFFGTLDGSGPPRLPGWTAPSQLSVSLPFPPAPGGMVTVSGHFDYGGSTLMAVLPLPGLRVNYSYSQRWIGW